MLSIRYRCTVQTPMFIAGATPTESPELRPPSFRGALRYWYRTLLGARGISDPAALNAAEAMVFGNTARASAVQVRTLDSGSSSYKSPPACVADDLPSTSGIQYLWHYLSDDERRWIPPRTTFDVQLTGIPREDISPQRALTEASRALWLLTHLGGVGARSRRFAGSFGVEIVDAPSEVSVPSFYGGSIRPDQLGNHLQSLVEDTREDLSDAFAHLGRARLWHVPYDGTCSTIVDTVGKEYKQFRNTKTAGQRVGFGLPIEDVEVKRSKQHGTDDVARRASPVWMQVIRNEKGNYDAVFTFFENEFLPEPESVMIDGQPFSRVFRSTVSRFMESIEAHRIF